ncbi:MAG: hypothetical protein GTO02_15895, partial [Candidatus Dadabacteria bacterium]|nr:hypothetical protein [Candidatus Dadabacteria bacterium]
MLKFTSYHEAVQVAKETELSAYDFDPYSLVEIVHEEGTILHYKSAFIKEWKDYILVFTEHHGTHVYHKSDLHDYATYIRKEPEKLEFTGYVDKCEFCEKEFKVENLEYAHHPDFEKYDESEYYVFCADCQDIVGSKFEDLWRKLNTEGAYDMEK